MMGHERRFTRSDYSMENLCSVGNHRSGEVDYKQ